jgi:hypothetical protein
VFSYLVVIRLHILPAKFWLAKGRKELAQVPPRLFGKLNVDTLSNGRLGQDLEKESTVSTLVIKDLGFGFWTGIAHRPTAHRSHAHGSNFSSTNESINVI